MSSRIRRVVESRIFWKYVALLLALMILSGYLLTQQQGAFSARSLAEGVFYSVVTGLIVSLFYDIGARRDMAILIDDEREYVRQLMTDRLLTKVDFDRLTQAEANIVAERIAANDYMMQLVTTSLLGDQGRTIFHTWLRLLSKRRILNSVIVENRLCRVPDRDDVYVLEFRQNFHTSPLKEGFVIVFTRDNDLFNDIMTSGIAVDEMIGTSPDEWKDIDAQVKTLSFSAYRNHLGRRESVEILPRSIKAADLGAKLGKSVDEDSVRAYEFELHEDDDWTYEYFYRVTNRLSDPYYYWMAVNPMFVNKLIIDYRELKPLVGRVSANCILTSSDPSHDRQLGVYAVNVGSLVWPGQGAIIVWRAA